MILVPASGVIPPIMVDVAAGQVPGIEGVADLFSDQIHPNGFGFYLLSLAVYQGIFNESPEGVTGAHVTGEFNNALVDYTLPSDETAAFLQKRVAEEMVRYGF